MADIERYKILIVVIFPKLINKLPSQTMPAYCYSEMDL